MPSFFLFRNGGPDVHRTDLSSMNYLFLFSHRCHPICLKDTLGERNVSHSADRMKDITIPLCNFHRQPLSFRVCRGTRDTQSLFPALPGGMAILCGTGPLHPPRFPYPPPKASLSPYHHAAPVFPCHRRCPHSVQYMYWSSGRCPQDGQVHFPWWMGSADTGTNAPPPATAAPPGTGIPACGAPDTDP